MPDEVNINKTDSGWDGVDRRKKSDAVTEITEWHKSLEAWQVGVDRKQSFTTFLVGIVSLILVVGFIATFAAGSSLQDDQNERAISLAQANTELAQAIQTERRESLVRSCRDTNSKNRAALIEIRQLPVGAREVTSKVVDAIAPFREDCGAYADSRVRAR